MLKKAGIVVAAAAATLLAVSPLAFAGEHGDWGHHRGSDNTNSAAGDTTQGLVNVSGNNVAVPVQALCNNDVSAAVAGVGAAVPVQKVAVPVSAVLGLLGNAAGGDSSTTLTDSRACTQGATNAGDATTQGIDD